MEIANYLEIELDLRETDDGPEDNDTGEDMNQASAEAPEGSDKMKTSTRSCRRLSSS